MAKVIYECGCKAGGDLISPYCPVHTNMPIVKEIDNSTTKKQETNIMTTENKETEFDVRRIRPMIQFTQHVSDDMEDILNRDIDYIGNTTEARLYKTREKMTFTRAKNTIRRTGWYFTEPYPACGHILDETDIIREDDTIIGRV